MSHTTKDKPIEHKEDPVDELVPLHIIRTETVLSRLPVHQLSRNAVVNIHIKRTNSRGERELFWRVSPNADYGHPRQMAYRIDKLIIDRKIYELGRPLPRVIRLQSARQICRDLNIREGKGVNLVRNAMYQNAGALITAELSYKGRDGKLKKLSGAFTRYGVFFIGDTLPGDGGDTAEDVYVILNDPYYTVLNNAIERPLDYGYFASLTTPSAQRWYEIASYKIFAAIEHEYPEAKLLYSEYCMFSGHKRRTTHDAFVKHMYKVHKPHRTSKYIQQVRYQRITDQDGTLDWIIYYVPGERAHAQYNAFSGKKQTVAAASGKDTAGTSTKTSAKQPSPGEQSATLVRVFNHRVHNNESMTPPAKALKQAADLIAAHGFAHAQFIVNFGCDRALEKNWTPDFFGGILAHKTQALDTYAKLERMRRRQEIEEREKQLQEEFETYVRHEVGQIRATLPPDKFAVIEEAVRAELISEGTFPSMLRLGVQMGIDARLKEQIGVPPFEEWRKNASASNLDPAAAEDSDEHTGQTIDASPDGPTEGII